MRKWRHYYAYLEKVIPMCFTYILIKWSASKVVFGKIKSIILTHQKMLKGSKALICCTYIFLSQNDKNMLSCKMVLILGKNVWTDNAGTQGCEKRHHLRTRGKDEILGRNNITWSLYDSLLIIKMLPRR